MRGARSTTSRRDWNAAKLTIMKRVGASKAKLIDGGRAMPPGAAMQMSVPITFASTSSQTMAQVKLNLFLSIDGPTSIDPVPRSVIAEVEFAIDPDRGMPSN